MARIRTIKPQFWTDEDMVELPFEYRLLYIGMWNFTDDDGFIEDKPKQIKLQVFPGDDVNVVAGIRALVKCGALERLTLAGDKVLRVKGWKAHQVISRPTKSKYADAYADYQAGRSTHGGLTEDSRRTPSGREGKGKEGKGKEDTQVGGGGYVSSAAPNEPPPPPTPDILDSMSEPWRCPDHQGIDSPCNQCKRYKAAWKALEAERAKEAKAASRRAANNARAAERAAEDAERRSVDPDAARKAAEAAKAALRAARSKEAS